MASFFKTGEILQLVVFGHKEKATAQWYTEIIEPLKNQ